MKFQPATGVNVFYVKNHLSALLREAENGRSFLIHRRGKPVACLKPLPGPRKDHDVLSIKEILQSIRREIPGSLKVRKLIEEGLRK